MNCGRGFCYWGWLCMRDGQGVYGKSLYLPLYFAVDLKLHLKKIVF